MEQPVNLNRQLVWVSLTHNEQALLSEDNEILYRVTRTHAGSQVWSFGSKEYFGLDAAKQAVAKHFNATAHVSNLLSKI